MWPRWGPAALVLLAVGWGLAKDSSPGRHREQAGSCRQQAGYAEQGARQVCPNPAALPTPNSTTAAPPAAGSAAPSAATHSAAPRGQRAQWHSRPTNDGLYIVRFKEYHMAASHRQALQDSLSSIAAQGSWEWVDRNNPAARFPTDFGLLRLAAPADGIKAHIEQLAFVRDVHPERQITRSLLSEGDPAAEQQREGTLHAQFAPCSSSSGHGADGGSGGAELQQGEQCVAKRPGRMQTRPTFSLEDNLEAEAEAEEPVGGQRVANDTVTPGSGGGRRRRRLLQGGRTLASILQADTIWEQGFRGQGVKMGVFDTGIRGDHPDVKHIVERSNWTHEPTLDDGLGHGSFVAGVIAGTDPACPGLAPEVLLHTFRVFTNDQVSYTSWFLDAFNYAIATRMNIVNLSIGGPDYLDAPFVDKVGEITSNGIIMVSAIGNDGPLYGTLNNPADQNDVIGIGGIDYGDQIAPFSSRGMSTWEIPLGYGRSKPDVMAYGRDVQGSRIGGGCRSLSGTSVASPVVAGAVCLLSSVVPEDKRWQILNPASMKQALVEGAIRLPGLNLYEQGAGKLSVVNSKAILERYIPRASVVPRKLNLTDHPYMWPFSRQPLYAGAMPLMFNATILNGMALTGELEGPPTWTPADEGGRHLDIQFEYPTQLWPWSGYLAIYLRVKQEGAAYAGTATGEIRFVVVSPPLRGQTGLQRSIVRMPVQAEIIPTPPREKRVLWDQFHSVRYPPAYFPRDDLQVRHDILDWHGDHPHTNFHDMFNQLRDDGFFLEVLASPATCFNASNYGTLLVVDSEDEWYREEIAKLAADVEQLGMGLLVFADWYHLDTIRKLRFFDDNTRSWWEAATGGANVPALNDLLTPYGVAFDSGALEADISIEGIQPPFHMASGVTIKALPVGAWLHRATPKQKEGQEARPGSAVLGLLQHGRGRVGLYGDSNCLDSSHMKSNCFKLLERMLEWAAGGDVPQLTPESALLHNHHGNFEGLPQRRHDFNFSAVSPVSLNPLRCYANSPLQYHGATFEQWNVELTRPVRQPVAVQQQQQAAADAGSDKLVGEGEQQPAEGASAGSAGQQQTVDGGATGGAAGQAQAQGQEQQPQQQADGQQQQQAQPQETQQQQTQSQETQQQAATQQPADGGSQQQEQQAVTQDAAKDTAEEQQQGASQGAEGQQQQQQDPAQQQQQQGEAVQQQAAAEGQEDTQEQKQEQQQEQEQQQPEKDTAQQAQTQQEGQQQRQEEEEGAGHTSAVSKSEDGREHPDINQLAQFGTGLPQDVDKEQRPLQPADGGAQEHPPDGTSGSSGEGKVHGEGEAARISSLMHQQTAAAEEAAAEAAARKGKLGFLQFPLLQTVCVLGLLAVVVCARSRRRRQAALPFRIQSRRLLLPIWGTLGLSNGQRDRHD